MDDALLNCMTGVCCPPAQQVQALAGAMVKAGLFQTTVEPAAASARENGKALDETCAQAAAAWVLKHFDLAEKGTLKPLRESILRLSKAKA